MKISTALSLFVILAVAWKGVSYLKEEHEKTSQRRIDAMVAANAEEERQEDALRKNVEPKCKAAIENALRPTRVLDYALREVTPTSTGYRAYQHVDIGKGQQGIACYLDRSFTVLNIGTANDQWLPRWRDVTPR